MSKYRVSITDRKGKAIQFMLDCTMDGKASWSSLECGAFTYDDGVADLEPCRAGKLAWLALYGGERVTDSNLVFHLDGFFNCDSAEKEGKGWIYHTDNLSMAVGPIKWKLLDS